MAGAMRKVGEYLGLVEQADFDDEFDDLDPDEAPVRQAPVRQAAPAVVRPSTVSSIDERRRVERPERRASTASDLARIETVTPRTYNDARTVGEHYRSGVPVIMNLSEIDDDDAKRLVDFAAGLVFAVHGSINRVTAKVFLLSPENISVTDEDKQRIAAGGFFNQS
ncbi:cell division protein SepF [Aeromicrobium endophyticum]|uniref:Cell division protein SepF n=1 Tax=Aeromicrobium endophyticum TaxID=2292704 RepID=A0A371P4B4_9ACTN|nr:cell division protein SepF [Aeromicrobium endophyticum]REK70398.1 cell division protein SepF [Aeromicrobium endophyticum]